MTNGTCHAVSLDRVSFGCYDRDIPIQNRNKNVDEEAVFRNSAAESVRCKLKAHAADGNVWLPPLSVRRGFRVKGVPVQLR
mgnify:FL=1